MRVRSRASARIGAAALLAAGAVSLAGAPAQAADTKADLELTVAGTTLAEGTTEKIGWMKVKNNGPGTPSALTVGVDLSSLYDERIWSLPLGEDCKGDGVSAVVCQVPAAQIPGPGETLEFPVVTIKDAEGVDGGDSHVRFFLKSPDDTTPDNNFKDVKLEFEGTKGVDLGVVVPDVKTKFSLDGGEQPNQPALHPGDETGVVGEVINQGDTVAKGIEIKLQLPQHVSFTEQYEGCEYSADERTATCRDEGLLLAPQEVLVIPFPIKVAADVKAPATLPNGSLAADALAEAPADSPLLLGQARKTTFKNAKLLGKGARVADVDASDNVDDYAVVVAAKGGAGGGAGDGAGGGAGGGDGGLPVTGPQAGLIGGIGVAVLGAGAAMFLVARRRRVVLVTPGDEKPMA